MKVYELSRELGINNNQIKVAAGLLDNPIKHHMHDITPEFELQLREYFENADIEPEEKKEPTRPWDGDSNPWSQSLLSTKTLHKGYHCRFIRRENLQKWVDRNYKIADAKDYGGVAEVIPGEEAADGTLLKRR
jgi:hypothetical protein